MTSKILAAALAALFCAATAEAMQYRGKGPAPMSAEMKKELRISDSQAAKLEENRKQGGEKMKALFQEMREKRKAFDQALRAPDTAAVKKIHSQIKELMGKMADVRLEGILAVRKILTPEQLAKFHDMISKGPGLSPEMMAGPDADMPGPDMGCRCSDGPKGRGHGKCDGTGRNDGPGQCRKKHHRRGMMASPDTENDKPEGGQPAPEAANTKAQEKK